MLVPTVSIIVPCCNERPFLVPFLDAVLAQAHAHGQCEVLIADGASTDGSRAVLDARAATTPLLRIVDNPQRLVATGLNAALALAHGDVLVRLDVHTTYAPDYLTQCLAVLAETGAANVGGPWVARGTTPMSRAIAAAFQTPFAVGGARSHDATWEGPVASVYLGCWPRASFAAVGTFDAGLVRNQDDEHNFRLSQAGLRIWQSPRIRSWYHPRPSLRALWRQWHQYGYWKVAVGRKHRRPTSLRQLVPALFLSTVGLLLLGSLVWPATRPLCAFTLALYGAFLLTACGVTAWGVRHQPGAWAHLVPRLPAVFACFHVAYGTGFLRGLWDFLLWRRAPRGALTTLTR
jgi:glycosyltransferase involved in cell wall biosynthesis